MSEIFNIGFNGHSFAINLDIMAKAKLLFDMTVVVPNENLLNISKDAYLLITLVRQGKEIQINKETKVELIYFVNHWLKNDNTYTTLKNLESLETEIISLIKDITNHLAQKYIEQIEKEEKRKIEYSRLLTEKKFIAEKAKELLDLDVKEITQENASVFLTIDKIPKIKDMENDWLYDLISDDNISKIFFLRSKRLFHLKAKFIVSAITKNDYICAEKLIDLLITTSTYEDFHERNSWEHDLVLSIKYFLEAFCFDDYSVCKLNKNVSDKTKIFCIILAEKAMKCLNYESQKILLGELAILDSSKVYEKLYVDNLLLDATNYHRKPRPKGWGSPHVINRVQLEISQAMRYLALMKRIDILTKILTIMNSSERCGAHDVEQKINELRYYLDSDELDELKAKLI